RMAHIGGNIIYGEGRRTYEKTSPRSATLTTYDAPPATPADCLTVVGWHQARHRAVRWTQQVLETRCRSRGDQVCEYRCSWE
ncbi:MAG: hypothetical protein ACXWLR_11260, partial [Myxococcales bacterium]